jgi:TPR repeat protein
MRDTRRASRVMLAALALALCAQSGEPSQQSRTPAVREAEEDYLRGLRFADGDGVERNYVEAARYYRRAAVKGYAPAQHNLAWFLENGRGVKQDLAEAAAWYRKAAEQGDSESQNNLGTLYAAGRGVSQDDTEAARWYGLAAKQGDPEGLTNFANMLLQGRGVARDPSAAFGFCRQAAEAGHAAARHNLALMYANGEGIGRDRVAAWAWLDLAAAEIGSSTSLRERIAQDMTPGEIAEARKLAARQRQLFDEKRKDNEK